MSEVYSLKEGFKEESQPGTKGANVDYVSCSPYRVPIARLVAAQSAIEAKSEASQPQARCGESET